MAFSSKIDIVLQSNGNSFYVDVVLVSFNKAFRDKGIILDQKYILKISLDFLNEDFTTSKTRIIAIKVTLNPFWIQINIWIQTIFNPNSHLGPNLQLDSNQHLDPYPNLMSLSIIGSKSTFGFGSLYL